MIYDEPMYTRQQVSLIENISISKLYTLELNNLVTLGSEIENKQRYLYCLNVLFFHHY